MEHECAPNFPLSNAEGEIWCAAETNSEESDKCAGEGISMMERQNLRSGKIEERHAEKLSGVKTDATRMRPNKISSKNDV